MDNPRYVTLRDYVRVVRDHLLLIAVITVVFAAAALAFSIRQAPTYEAQSAISFQDISSSLQLVGNNATPAVSPGQLALSNAGVVTQLATAQRVKRILRSPQPPAALASQVTAFADPQTDFVVIQASARTGQLAAALANGFASANVTRANRAARQRFQNAAQVLRTRIKIASHDPTSRAVLADRLSQIAAAGDVARPAAVATVAQPPSAPNSPRPVRNTLLGALVGVVLGIVAAFVRDSLDLRLRGVKEIEERTGLPLVGRVSADALGRVALAAGSNGRSMAWADVEAFRILRTNLDYLDVDRPVRSVLVTSALPEEGKSTVAAALAAAVAATGKRALLVECDLRAPVLAARLGLSQGPGLVDYLSGKVDPQATLQAVDVAESDAIPGSGANGVAPTNGVGLPAQPADAGQPRRLTCITAGAPTPRPAEMLGSGRFRDFLEEVSQAYDLVVLDGTPLLPLVDTLELVPRVDAVLMCVRVAQTTRTQAQAARSALAHFPDRPTGVVATGLRAKDEGAYAGYAYYYGYSRAPTGV